MLSIALARAELRLNKVTAECSSQSCPLKCVAALDQYSLARRVVIVDKIRARQRPESERGLIGEAIAIEPGRNDRVEIRPIDRGALGGEPFHRRLKPGNDDLHAIRLGKPDELIEHGDRRGIFIFAAIHQPRRDRLKRVGIKRLETVPIQLAHHQQMRIFGNRKVVDVQRADERCRRRGQAVGRYLALNRVIPRGCVFGDVQINPNDRIAERVTRTQRSQVDLTVVAVHRQKRTRQFALAGGQAGLSEIAGAVRIDRHRQRLVCADAIRGNRRREIDAKFPAQALRQIAHLQCQARPFIFRGRDSNLLVARNRQHRIVHINEVQRDRCCDR